MAPLGQTVEINDVAYHIHPDAIGRLESCYRPKPSSGGVLPYDLLPITIFDVGQSQYNASSMKQWIASYLAKDDVFNEGFLQGGYLRLKPVV